MSILMLGCTNMSTHAGLYQGVLPGLYLVCSCPGEAVPALEVLLVWYPAAAAHNSQLSVSCNTEDVKGTDLQVSKI